MSSLENDKIQIGNSEQTLQAFSNPQEEIAYLKQKLEESQTEFQEFQESSRDLEAEYETQIKQLEIKDRESQNLINRLEDELDQLRSRYNSYTNDTQLKLNEYQQQISEYTTINERLTTYIRELEQSNDDLERARRALAASLEDFEAQLNQQIERNVLLENEVSEKEELECIVQRLKEEARDLRHELVVNKNFADSKSKRKQLMLDLSQAQKTVDSSLQSVESITNKLDESSLEENSRLDSQTIDSPSWNGDISKRPSQVDSTTSPMTPKDGTPKFSYSTSQSSQTTNSTNSKSQATSTPPASTLPSINVSTSSRISALNIVSDLLRKVGALESKLASAKKVTS